MLSTSPPIHLGVNIDHVATLRQARGTRYPEPVQAALVAEQGGADSITVHLREDRRHIQERDVELLSQTIQTRINLEMAVTDDMLAIAERLSPADCCLVPERREELTTEGGLDVAGQRERISTAVARLKAASIRVSLFIDPDLKQIDTASAIGADAVEIHTGRYADAISSTSQLKELQTVIAAAEHAAGTGMRVHAGHGLNYHNVQPIAAITVVEELNIGHAIVARAVFVGLERAVSTIKRLMLEARA
jgi:pyridoxine 5-phosphate synthase